MMLTVHMFPHIEVLLQRNVGNISQTFPDFSSFRKYIFPSLSSSYGERATADQTIQPTNDPQPAAAMTDGVLGNLKERNGEPRVLEVELTASLNCRVQELDSNGGGEGGSGQAVRVHCTDERRGERGRGG